MEAKISGDIISVPQGPRGGTLIIVVVVDIIHEPSSGPQNGLPNPTCSNSANPLQNKSAHCATVHRVQGCALWFDPQAHPVHRCRSEPSSDAFNSNPTTLATTLFQEERDTGDE